MTHATCTHCDGTHGGCTVTNGEDGPAVHGCDGCSLPCCGFCEHEEVEAKPIIDLRPRHEVLYGRGQITYDAYLCLCSLASHLETANGAAADTIFGVAYHAACSKLEEEVAREAELHEAADELGVDIGVRRAINALEGYGFLFGGCGCKAPRLGPQRFVRIGLSVGHAPRCETCLSIVADRFVETR